jgi:hypothetical protein
MPEIVIPRTRSAKAGPEDPVVSHGNGDDQGLQTPGKNAEEPGGASFVGTACGHGNRS